MTVAWYDVPVLSPDGRYLVFTGTPPQGNNMLWLRPIDSLEARPIPGTENAFFPFWSPDSRYIGFTTQGKLKKVGIGGSPPVTLCDMFALAGPGTGME